MTHAVSALTRLPPDMLIRAVELIDFMLGEGLRLDDADDVLTAMAGHIRAAGLPLDRAVSIVPLLHAEAIASSRFWERGKGARSYSVPFGPDAGQGYATSPAAVVHETGEWLTLWLPDTPDDAYDIVAQLKEEGMTHYVMAPVFMKSGMASTFSFATASPAGFSDTDLIFLRAVFPALAAAQEILATARAMSEVMRIYVGEEPRKRILSGDVRRGEVMRIRSVILFADMRRFTELTAVMSAEQATGLLNRYFDCVVPHIETQGGEVLKFMGDGVLAIFRARGDGRDSCARALDAARAALQTVAAETGDPPFGVGIALHFGEVAYGNVGSGMRLDYTVIGRDVNLASRVAGLCGGLGHDLLITGDLRARLGDVAAKGCGSHRLKGIAAPVELYSVSAAPSRP